jgi:dTDP-D-glucose 4,6-dehydratase
VVSSDHFFGSDVSLIHADNSFSESLDFTQNNVMGTHVLLEAARVANIRRFIHISTDEVYGELKAEAVSRWFGQALATFLSSIYMGHSTRASKKVYWHLQIRTRQPKQPPNA